MQLVEKHIIRKSDSRFSAIDEMAYRSKNLYNASLYAVRQHFFNTEQYLAYATLQKQFQEDNQYDYRNLPSKVAQWTMKMVDQNFRSFFKSNTDFKKNPQKYTGKPKIPKYLDKANGRYLLTFTNQAISKRDLDKYGLINLSGLNLAIPTKLSYNEICQVRVVKKVNSYVVEVIYNKPEENLKPDNGRYAAIDLGVNNLATVTSNVDGFIPFVISGRKLKSINHKYNKDLSQAKSILDTRNGVKSSAKTKRMTHKRNERINDYLHKTSRMIVNQLIASNINTLVIGNNKGWKQDINIGAVNNQNFVQIPHSRLISMLVYKCQLAGITVEIIEEGYTSKCSFLDCEEICKHDKYAGKRIYRGLFKSSNGRLINADVNGSYNILVKCKPNAFANGVRGVVVHPSIIKIEN